ncbi:MAG: ATP-binding protein [Lachnospiraceae bacterium]|nr:ATP-binding protein [Lachnospiraceae bacterium]
MDRNIDEIYSSDRVKLGENALQVMQHTIRFNGGVGVMSGYYDAELTILSVSDLLLHNLGYSYEALMKKTKGSLKNFFYGENSSFLEAERFRRIEGEGEGQVLTADGAPVFVRLYKKDAIDTEGNPIWVMSVQMNLAYENLSLVNESIRSALWYFDCDENSEIIRVSWSHAFRRILGYHDSIDFPNRLTSWSDLLHPEDIDAEKRSLMQAQRAAAFHRAFTSANLCEYYVNLEQNTFDTFKVEDSLMTAFESSETWDELVSFFVKNYVIEQDRKAVRDFYDRSEIAAKLKGLETELSQECRIILDGEERWVRNVIMRGEIEDSEYAMIFLRDITESRADSERRQQLASDNASMELLIQSMVRLVDRFVVCDLAEDRYDFYSLQGEMIYEPSGSYHDFVAQVITKYKTLEPLDALETLISPENVRKNLPDEKSIYKYEYCSLDENIYKIASFLPLEWEGDKLIKALLVSMDVSPEKKAEIESRKALKEAYRSAENASRAKTQFLSNMSHDIRTPMNAIVGLTAIAGANIENQEKVVECLGKITKSSRHLLGLINEVFDMARIESGKMSLTEEDFNLPELVDNLITMTKTSIDEHHHSFEVHIDHIEHEAVCGDSLRIQQVFVNLMSNAIKYTPDGGHIIFSIREKPNGFSELGCYEFTIEDDGIGMTPEFQKIMFDPFSRADDHRTTKVQGTGLGMAITRNIVHLMNGDIQVDSAPNKGTKITVTVYLKLQESEKEQEKELVDLPVLVVDDDRTCCESTVATCRQSILKKNGEDARDCLEDFANADYSGKRILLVEDNELNREIAIEIIGMTGVEIDVAENGKIAVDKIADAPENWYDLVFMDIQMPIMNGYEATAAIRSLSGARGHVPIIAMTANAFAEDVQLAKNTGMNEHMAKPLDMHKLNEILKTWL